MRFLVFLLGALMATHSGAQSLAPGGLGNTKEPLLLLPKPGGGMLVQRSFSHPGITHKPGSPRTQFTALLPDEQPWLMAFNVPTDKATTNLFLYDGWLASTDRLLANHRLRRFEKNISASISSNVYHMAFQRQQVVENEVFMLLVSPVAQTAVVQLPKTFFGVERTIRYAMKAGEAKFIHITIPPKEYTVIAWQKSPQLRTKTALSQWQFAFDSSDRLGFAQLAKTRMSPVMVPHTWNAADIFDQRTFKDSLNIMELFRRGNGWYKTKFHIAAGSQNRDWEIEFLGVNQVAEVWINGQYLGRHLGGYTGFQFPLNKHLRYGAENQLVVKADNRYRFDIPPHTADYNFQGGIYREVYLRSKPKSHVAGLKITTPRVSHRNALLQVNTRLQQAPAGGMLRLNLVNPYGEIAQTLSAPLTGNQQAIMVSDTVRDPLLWSPQRPVLYQLVAQIYDADGRLLDETTETMGFRSFAMRADSGFFVNGQPLKLQGVNVHQDYFMQGWATDSARKRADYLLMKQMGVNYVRMSHYPKHPYELHLCDSLGFVVWEEVPVVNTVGRDSFIANANRMMVEMIERDYNHPSIAFWGVGNEYYRNFFTNVEADYALQSTRLLHETARRLDPNRLTIQAQNDLVDDRIMPLTQVQGRNRYFGWYEKTYNDFEHEMEEEHRKYPDWKLLVSEYGAEGKYGHHVANPLVFDHSETYQLALHKEYWRVIARHPYIAGGTIWNMFDFASFAKIGNSPHLNKKGMMTYDRKPKDVFFWYQSQWTQTPMVRIAGHTNTHRRAEQGKALPLEVFSNAEEVELFVNGNSLGRRKKAEGFVFNISLPEGYHQLKAVAHHQGQTMSDETAFYLRLTQPGGTATGIKDLYGDGF